ncbi:MAG: Uncharacterized protein FD167_6133 [bacterium]|nr:MAG: Uncharacterized protein FD167_6133 [bacterium]
MDGRDILQLLPGTKKRLGIKVPGENKFLYAGSAIFGAVLVTVFALGRQEVSLKANIKQINDEIVAQEQKRNKNDEAEIRSTKDRLSLIQDLIDKHVHWTQAFTWLEGMLQSSVQIKNVSMTAEGDLDITGRATNYTIMARQIAAFLTDDRVIDLQIGKIGSNSEGMIDFDLSLKVDFTKIIYK